MSPLCFPIVYAVSSYLSFHFLVFPPLILHIATSSQAEERHVQSQRNSIAVQEAKFTIFKELMESLFSSFDSLVGVTSFVELSSGGNFVLRGMGGVISTPAPRLLLRDSLAPQ